MDPATLAHFNQRVRPVLNESFDGFLVMGYVTNSKGKRERVALVDGGSDAAIVDALQPYIMQANMWLMREGSPAPSVGKDSEEEEAKPE